MVTAYLMLGGNIGDREDYLRQTIDFLRRDVGRITTLSSVYESEPWGFDEPKWFLNQAVAIETNLSPFELLKKTQDIELSLGRFNDSMIRASIKKYLSRTIDIDILLYGYEIINSPTLVIPHPLMCERMFVLQAMSEIAPELEHPALRCTMKNLKNNCKDNKIVVKF